MNIAELVRQKLQEEYSAGMTQLEMAKKYGLGQSHISRIISGKKSISFEMLETMFPNATVNLDGDHISIHADHNSGNVVGVNRGKISSDCMTTVIDKILESEELSDAEKIKVMKVLKK